MDPTTKEELYGKIVIPSCMEASLQNSFASGFANLLYTAEYYALRFIFRQDVTGVTASLGFAVSMCIIFCRVIDYAQNQERQPNK